MMSGLQCARHAFEHMSGLAAHSAVFGSVIIRFIYSLDCTLPPKCFWLKFTYCVICDAFFDTFYIVTHSTHSIVIIIMRYSKL